MQERGDPEHEQRHRDQAGSHEGQHPADGDPAALAYPAPITSTMSGPGVTGMAARKAK